MKKLLKKYFGYDEFRPLQKEIIDTVLTGEDSFVLMPTGGGKSLCYQLPALKLRGITLVISPLIALMKDQVDGLKANGIEAEFINSSLLPEEIEKVYKKIEGNETKIIYIAPERFGVSDFKEFILKQKVDLIAVDEAHCISEWGHDFRPEYRNLNSLKTLFPKTSIIALTATATSQVKKDIIKQLNIAENKSFISGFNRENLKLSIVKKKDSFFKLLNLLDSYGGESVIIYCFSRKDTERIAENLRIKGYKARAYHAGLEKNKRTTVQNQFIKDEVDIIVATIAFGMGIDKPDVRLVVHYTFPKTLEGYYQEIGRAGRDGLPSECVMFYTYADARKHEFFIYQNETKEKEEQLKKLSEVIEYAELETCRKKYLLNYFGEELNENCGACDICLTKREKFDATVLAQKILSAIIKTGNRFGKNYITAVLLGKNISRLKRNEHNQLSVFGIVKDYSEDDLEQIINNLISTGHISKTQDQYPTLNITSKGILFLKNKEKMELSKPIKDSLENAHKKDFDHNLKLFNLLRELRKKIADQENVPPFIIFGDASLKEMSTYFPEDKASFNKIIGVGALKLKKYGDQFLKLIKKFSKENNISPIKIDRWKKEKLNPSPKIRKTEYYTKTKELLDKKVSIDRIARNQDSQESTIINHIEKLLDLKTELDLDYLKLPSDKYKIIKSAFEEMGDQFLKPVFEHLEGKYNYDDLKLVRVIMKN
ncbi:DNA helicase RecQ [bacterium]|nr:DNA helicase RecQ [bacterium]